MKRKSLLFLLLFTLLAPWAANAQTTLEIGDGTSAGYYTPIGTYYNYSITEQLYTAEEIGTAGSISSISFYYAYTAAVDFDITVYMANVDATDLTTSISLAEADEVFSGTISVTGAEWATIDLDTPFAYDGTSNLLIGVNKTGGSNWFSGNTWNYTSVNNMARYTQNDSSPYDISATVPGTLTTNRPNIQMVIIPSGSSVCEKPETMEASNVTSNSAVLTWTSGSGTFNLEYKLASAEDWISLLTNTTATTYTLQDLNPDKAYQARVQSVCGEDVSGWKSVNFRTSFAIPLIEEFGTSIPTGWAMYTGLLENVMAGTAELTSTTYGWNFGEGNGVFDNHAYVNIYGSNCHKWLVLPTVTMEDSIQLQFDMALTAYNSNIPEPILTGIDDKFIVLINVGSNWTILRQWDNAGSEYVYNDIASTTTGQTVSIDLSSYAGQQVAVAFYGESTESNADNNLHIDNVSITRVNATDMYIVTVSANPAIGGMVSGGGEFAYGQTCTLTATPAEGYSFVNWTENGEVVSTENPYTFSITGNRTLVANFMYNGGGGSHEYVDLGLPSGLLWATCNVGADTPEDYGDYFAWGETQPKDYYDWSTYQYCIGSNTTLTKYCSNSSYGYNGFTDNLTTLLPEDDAATANWGSDWRMPTKAEFQELLDNTTAIWTTQNGVDGRLFTASNGNSLFLPAAGYLYEGGFGDADWGYYWSSLLNTNLPKNAWELETRSQDFGVGTWDRYCGQPVRPVRFGQNTSFIIDATANPTEGGTVEGAGTYTEGATCTLTATPAVGYYFMNWTQDGVVVSSTATYSFVVNANVDLVANFAEGIFIGDGGSATSTFLPGYNYYNYSWTQQIYTADEIGAAGTINSIAFKNTGAEKTRTYNVYMLLTDKDAFESGTDWVAMSENDLVFEGELTFTVGEWTTITLDSPFDYDGTSNLIVGVADVTGSYSSSPHMACLVFEATSQAIRAYRDNSPYDIINPGVNGTVLDVKNQIVLNMSSGSFCEKPSNFVADDIQADQVHLTWEGGSGNYNLEYREASGGEWNTIAIIGTELWLTGLDAETDYNARIQSVCEDGSLSGWKTLNFTTPWDCPDGMVCIGSGTATSTFLPSYNFYNYSLTQQIYTAEEIGTSGMITSIAFFNGGAEKTRTFDFYMKHTTKNNFSSNTDWIAVSPSDLVFSGSVTMVADDWTIITFDTPFVYNGTSNVVLVADDNTGDYTSSPHMACRVFDADGTQAIYKYADGTDYDPYNPSGYSGTLLTVKNQVILGMGGGSDYYVISATANPVEGGTVAGTGTFAEGATCTLTATPAEGYEFLNWNENNQVVSVDAMYSFTVEGNRNLVANFGNSIGTVTASYYPDPINPESPYVMVTWGTNTDSFEAQIGDGTSTNGIFPFHTLYNYSIAENLFLASELGGAGVTTAPITSISWYSTNTTGYNQEGISIWMANVDDETLMTTSHVVTGMTLVYTGAMTPLVGWNEFVFNQGTFAWDGHSNILICCQRNNGNWNSSIHWQHHDADFLAGAYKYTDRDPYDMETTSYSVSTTTYRANTLFKSSINRENSVSYKVYRTNCDDNNYSLIADNVTSPFIDSLWLQLPVGSYQYGVSFINDEEIVVSNCIDRNLYNYQITATPNFEEHGIVTGAGTYPGGSLCTLTAIPNDGYTFVNWTKDNVEVSTEATYSFTVTEDATYVANFMMSQGEVTQETNLAQGYNWWSTYVEQAGMDGLSMLEESLGDNGLTIRSQASGYNDYYDGYGWFGSLSGINNESSYRVITNAACSVTLTGSAAVPSQHPIVLSQGWKWIGYVPSTAMGVNEALANLDAVVGDKLKSQQGYADYYENYGWYGSLNTIEPGMGLMYFSANGETVTFTYPDNGRGGELRPNITGANNHWKPNVFAYPDNMTVMAVVELDGAEISSDNYELAAFAANGECRGSVKLTYAEPLHRYVAFLTISGKDAAELSFRLYDTKTNTEYYDAEESLDFIANAIIGDAEDLYTIHFRGTTGMDELANRVQVYPNPVNAGERFSIGMANAEPYPVHVEIVNALGVETLRITSVQTPVCIVAPTTAGVYTLRITVDGKGTVVRKLVVK